MAPKKADFHFVIDQSNAKFFREMINFIDKGKKAWIDVIYLEGEFSPILEFTELIPENGFGKFIIASTMKCDGYPCHVE